MSEKPTIADVIVKLEELSLGVQEDRYTQYLQYKFKELIADLKGVERVTDKEIIQYEGEYDEYPRNEYEVLRHAVRKLNKRIFGEG